MGFKPLQAAVVKRCYEAEAHAWMLLDGAPSWRQGRWPQPVNEAQDLSEQGSRDGNLGQLESDIAAVADHLGADLDQLTRARW